MNKPYLVYSKDTRERGWEVAVLYTDCSQVNAENEPFSSDEATILLRACRALGVPVQITFKSQAFCLDAVRLSNAHHMRQLGFDGNGQYLL